VECFRSEATLFFTRLVTGALVGRLHTIRQTANAERKVSHETFPPPTRQPKPKPHETQAPLPIQIGDFSMAMKRCIWTEKYGVPYHGICEGTMENKSDTKLDMTFRSGRVIDDNANEYTLSTGPYLYALPGILYLGSASSSQQLMPNLPVKFGFLIFSINRNATAVNLILKFASSGTPADSEVLFKDIPIREE
jgi:hypothetical protein